MFAYCQNNPVMSLDNSGTVAVAAGSGAMAALTGALAVATVALADIVTTVTAAVVEGISSVTKAVTPTRTKYKSDQSKKSYTVYTLSNPATNEVVYVGRTCNYEARMRAHALNPARKGLNSNVLHENLTYLQARAAEHAYIIAYQTIDKNDKTKNQINGVNPKRNDFSTIMNSGFGVSEALDSILTNEFLCIFEKP